MYSVLRRARSYLDSFADLPEAKNILERVNGFNSDLESVLRELELIENSNVFAFNSATGQFQIIPQMPEGEISFSPEKTRELIRGANPELAYTLRLKMKKEALKVAESLEVGFRRGVMDWVKSEFKFIPERNNLRTSFEQLAMPARLYSHHQGILESTEEYNETLAIRMFEEKHEGGWKKVFEEMGQDEFAQRVSEFFGNGVSPIPSPIYPIFGNHYDISGLTPPLLLDIWGGFYKPFIPIGFKTDSSERKFFLTGLHSGGKSFFLENIVLASVLGNLGLSLPANHITLPRHERIFYYRNEGDTNGGGKCETELRRVREIIQEAGERDLVVIDELLDSANAGIATALSPKIFGQLVNSPATVFISSHRNSNYQWLAERGWTLLHPGHTIDDEKVVPTYKIERGSPNEEANIKYMEARYQDIFGE